MIETDAPYKCEFCGRPMKKKIKSHGHIFCTKHYNQFRKYGKVLDTNPRTAFDRNEFHVHGPVTYIDLYDKNQNVVAQAIIDTEDLPKVRYTKWKLSASGYVMNTPKFKASNMHMSRQILGVDCPVDHRNHNTLDNRKQNLRPVTKSQNQMNSNYKGVSNLPGGKFYAHIKINGKLLNLGHYVFETEALFARWYAETVLFGEFRYPKKRPEISEDREKQIIEYVMRKVQRLPLPASPNQTVTMDGT